MGVRRSGKHLVEKLHEQKILGVRKITRHLLFDRSPFLLPELLRTEYALHPQGFHLQRRFQVVLGYGKVILSHGLLGIGVEVCRP